MKLTFEMPIRPVAWQRAGKHGKTHFTPARTANFEKTVQFFASAAMAGKEPVDAPVEVLINFTYALPKGAAKEEKTAISKGNYLSKTSRPDIDNLIKAVLDGMNGVVYWDDACVWNITAIKTYGENDNIRIHILTNGDDK